VSDWVHDTPVEDTLRRLVQPREHSRRVVVGSNRNAAADLVQPAHPSRFGGRFGDRDMSPVSYYIFLGC